VKVRVLRVFTDEEHRFGNPLGLVDDGASITDADQRQALAAVLGYSETAYIDDPETGKVQFYSPRRAVPFAGHAAIGAAWAIARMLGHVPRVLRTPAIEAQVWIDGPLTWVRAPLAGTPPWWHERLPTPEAVEGLTGPLSPEQDMTQLWSWIDEDQGVMRVRTFASRVGLDEDEACGTGAMRMAAAFGRPLTLRHGRGSLIFAAPGPPGYADIGGYVAEDVPRQVTNLSCPNSV
jgi:predicted PhzF superfamily epimerase YddE/YHI9